MSTAILFAHGIVGTPKHFEKYIKLVPEDWTVVNLVLKGHLGTVKDFGNASMKEWKAQFHDELKKLTDTHDRVFIVAHSMSCLFSIEESLEQKVEAMFLLNIPVWARVTPRLLKSISQIYFNCVNEADPWVIAARELYGIGMDRNLLHYIKWPLRYFELFSEISHARKFISEVKIPSYIYISTKDEMTSPRGAKYIREHGRENMKVTELEGSGHLYFTDEAWETVLDDFRKFIIER